MAGKEWLPECPAGYALIVHTRQKRRGNGEESSQNFAERLLKEIQRRIRR
jgi:hypothetical protein